MSVLFDPTTTLTVIHAFGYYARYYFNMNMHIHFHPFFPSLRATLEEFQWYRHYNELVKYL